MKINDLQKAYPANQRLTHGTANVGQSIFTVGGDSPQSGPFITCSVSVEARTCNCLSRKDFFDRMNRMSQNKLKAARCAGYRISGAYQVRA